MSFSMVAFSPRRSSLRNIGAVPPFCDPIRAAFLPRGKAEAGIRGEVTSVMARAAMLPGMNFWQVDVAVVRDDEDDTLVLPIYVADRTWKTDWRPKVGEYVQGVIWVQGHAIGVGDGR